MICDVIYDKITSFNSSTTVLLVLITACFEFTNYTNIC
jgi:hypothetical protein